MHRLIRHVLLLALASASYNALATTFSPVYTSFTASGSVVIKAGIYPPVTCGISLVGHTNGDDTATITSVVFTGGGLCLTGSASGLPWTWRAVSLTTATLHGLKLTFAGLTCSPSPVSVVAAWSNSANTLSLANQAVGSCIIQGLSVSPNPPLVVVNS